MYARDALMYERDEPRRNPAAAANALFAASMRAKSPFARRGGPCYPRAMGSSEWSRARSR